MKNKIFSLISIFSILFFPTYGNTFTHDKLKEGIEKGVKSLEQEISVAQDNPPTQDPTDNSAATQTVKPTAPPSNAQ